MTNKRKVYEPYRQTLEESLEKYEVDEKDRVILLQKFLLSKPTLGSNEEIIMKMIVERKQYPIELTIEKGKIYELIGPNNRGKSMSIVAVSLLMGLDFDDYRVYMSKDNLCLHGENLKKEISTGNANVEFEIEKGKLRLQINIQDGKFSLSYWNGKEYWSGDDGPISERNLTKESDWEEYRRIVKEYFDVQLIGVGRNFVEQVGLEEAAQLRYFLNEVIAKISSMTNSIEAMKRGPRPETIQLEMIIKADQTIDQYKKEWFQLEKEKDELETAIHKMGQEINFVKNLFQKEEVCRFIELSSSFIRMEELERKLHEVDERIETIQCLINDINQALKRKQIIQSIMNNNEEFANELNRYCNSLSFPRPVMDELILAIRQNDINQLKVYKEEFWPDENTIDALEFLKGVQIGSYSLETKLSGFYYQGQLISDIADFKRSLEAAVRDATILRRLETYFTRFEQFLDELDVNTTNALQDEISILEELSYEVVAHKELREDLKVQRLHLNKDLEQLKASSGPYTDLQSALNCMNEKIDEKQLADLAHIVEKYGFNLTLQLANELWNLQKELEAQSLQTDHAMEKVRSHLREAQGRKHELEKELLIIQNDAALDKRIAKLKRVQGFFKNSRDYFKNRWKATKNPLNIQAKKDAEENQALLGGNFEKVIALINNRILERCPYVYLNNGLSISKHQVEKFDFQEGAFTISGFEPSSHLAGGLASYMTIFGLGTKNSNTIFGNYMYVDEIGDLGIYKNKIFEELVRLPHLSLAMFVDVDEYKADKELKRRI